MGVIGKIRSYSGLLIAIIGVGLVAFVLGDLFQYGPRSGGRPDMEIGKIGNTSISYPEFDQRFNQQLENWKQQTGITQPDPQQMYQMRQQVWEQMIQEILLEEELEKLGIDVSSDELLELITGSDPHPFIVQSFTDPQTGEFDPQQVRSFIQNIDMVDPSMRNQWIMLEQHIKNERKEAKYKNLVSKSLIVPGKIAEFDQVNNNTRVDINFIAKPYEAITDDEVTISDQDIRNAYRENKHMYRQEHTRDLEYVVVPVNPTDDDRQQIHNIMLELKEELETVENVERFVNSVSDRRFDPNYYAIGELSPEIDSVMFNSPEGTIYGPYEQNDAFIMAMLNDIQFRPDSMSASHILISYRDSQADQQQQIARDYTLAQEKADSLLTEVQNNPAQFSQYAMEFSDDPSAAMNQGDLGWFNDGDMVTEFNEAVIDGNIGDIVSVETDFGFHIIQITGKSPASKKVQVARIVRNIIPSSSTYRRVFAEVSEFAAMTRDKENFEAAAKEKGYSVRQATYIGKMDNNIPGAQNAREVIQWVYSDDVRVGATSQIFDLDDTFVLAKLINIREEGIAPLEEIREEMESIAIKNKKFEMISGEFRDMLSQHGSLDMIAEDLGLELHTAQNISFSTNNLPGFSNEPAAVGKAFAVEPNQVSNPVKGNNATFMVEVINREEAIIPDDLTAAKRRLQNNLSTRVANETYKALRENTKIEDNRPRFY